MFQSFAATTSPETAAPRVAALRAAMAAAKVDAFLVPRADAHQGEYVCDRDNRLAWLTSFTGSAGYAAITADQAGIFVDGRYTLQVRDQVDLDVFTPLNHPADKLGTWLAGTLGDGAIVAYDPWLYTLAQIEALEKQAPSLTFKPTDNLVDAVWEDQPSAPTDLMVPHPVEYTGQEHGEKITTLAGELGKAGHSAAVLTLTDSIAWLLNTRGSDIGQTPVALAFAILHADATVDLFLDPAKADDTLRAHLGKTVRIKDVTTFSSSLRELAAKVRVDRSSAPIAVVQTLKDAGIDIAYETDPTILPKARKNAVELAGAKAAHIRDGAAVAGFLAWLDAEAKAPKNLTEISIAQSLERFRRETNALQNISFDTISGGGQNGAIVHYRVTEDTNRAVNSGDVMLVDSGGQYLDGTTDITRTMAIGNVDDEARQAFTRVLQGMIAISRLRFPKGLSGRDIDALARAPLWMAGQDYDHGTGHGVGSYLSVHEGPQRISRVSEEPLQPGMILSNEPGYYREGAFGIRIENLIFVKQADPLDGADDRQMYEFETLTCAPIDRNMIFNPLLTRAELDWLNDYHAWVEETLTPLVPKDVAAWLKKACAPL